jgi:hypothetical protein
MAHHGGAPRDRPRSFVVRTSQGRLEVAVCDLCAAFVLAEGERQHWRWHLAQHPCERPRDELDMMPTVPMRRVTDRPRHAMRRRHALREE